MQNTEVGKFILKSKRTAWRQWSYHSCFWWSGLGFDQLCWHNFRIIGTDFRGISTEHNSRIIGLSLHIWRCGLGVVKVWLNLYHMIWQNIQTYGPIHARKCAYFSHWLLCLINFYVLFLIGKNHLGETKYKPLLWFSTKKMFIIAFIMDSSWAY